jgi:hypothetical protein
VALRAASSCRTCIGVAARATKEGVEFVDANGVARMKYTDLAAHEPALNETYFFNPKQYKLPW